jgi:protein-S-isoprenylcysteine O-methyltransferase Ste14
MKSLKPLMAVASVGMIAAGSIAIKLVAGTWNLPFFWGLLVIQALSGLAGIFVLDDALLKERMHPQGKDQDRGGRTLITLLWLSAIAVPALDVGRWHFSDTVPTSVQIIALILQALAWAGFIWTMKVNVYFSSVVRLQPDRSQKVITTGPYHFVRHPGYAFAAVAVITQALALGSWIALVPAMLLIAQFVYRSFLEEKILVDGLPGYIAYVHKVKARWIPGLI